MIDVGLGVWEAIVPADPGQRLRLRDRRRGAARPGLALAARGAARARRGCWTPAAWPRGGAAASRRRRSTDLLIYELHIGTFTPEGTFAAAAERLGRPGRARRHRGRDHAGGRVPRRARLGLRRRLHLRRPVLLRRPAGAGRVRRRGPPPRPGGDPRRRLQPPRRVGRRGDGGLRALLHRQVRDAVGQGDELRRRRLRPGARMGVPERRGLGARLRDRRAAPGRHPRDLRLRAPSTSSPRWRGASTPSTRATT